MKSQSRIPSRGVRPDIRERFRKILERTDEKLARGEYVPIRPSRPFAHYDPADTDPRREEER